MGSEIINRRKLLWRRLPGALGYASSGDYLETDYLLRRLLAGEMEKIRDRLATVAAAGHKSSLQEKFAESLQATASLREEFLPVPEEERRSRSFSATHEERLLDIDLAILDKVERLQSALDRLEEAASTERAIEELAFYEEGLSEIKELFHLRGRILLGP